MVIWHWMYFYCTVNYLKCAFKKQCSLNKNTNNVSNNKYSQTMNMFQLQWIYFQEEQHCSILKKGVFNILYHFFFNTTFWYSKITTLWEDVLTPFSKWMVASMFLDPISVMVATFKLLLGLEHGYLKDFLFSTSIYPHSTLHLRTCFGFHFSINHYRWEQGTVAVLRP